MNSLALQHASFDTAALEGELLPFVARTITLPYADYVGLKSDVSYWKAQHTRAIVREEALKEQLKHQDAIIRDLNQRLYGNIAKKAEVKPRLIRTTKEINPNDPKANRKARQGLVVLRAPISL